MQVSRFAALAAALFTFCAAPVLADGLGGLTGKTVTMLENRGLTMSEQEAMERITFHPFVPSSSYSEVALLPPFHGDDKDHPENRGIGYEYVSAGTTYVLREWPLAGGSAAKYPAVAPEGTCTTGHFTMGTTLHPRALAWTTTTLVFALQPDIPSGANPDFKALRQEWGRLVKRGACR